MTLTSAPSRRAVTMRLIVTACLIPFAACRDGEEQGMHVVTVKEPDTLPSWLAPTDKIEPAIWLRSREVGHEVLPSDPEVDRLRRALHQASIRFYEDTRMIANRTAQTSDMLGEAHQPERVVDIMTGMVDVADVSVQKKLYGEMCQHYLNIRKSGKDRTTAITQLIGSYKEQRGLQ